MSITIKNDHEITLIRRASQIVSETHKELEKHLKVGVSALSLDEIAESYIRSQDAIPTFKGYGGFPNSICLSINDCIIHGIPKKDLIIQDGDLVSIDIGAKYQGYCGDAARSYVIGKQVPARVKLLEVTKQALENAKSVLKDGAHLKDIAKAITDTVTPYGYGIVKGYTGHGIGQDMHEDPQIPNYYPFEQDLKDVRLMKGMVICIEPMITMSKTTTKDVKGKGIYTTSGVDSSHQEDEMLITEQGYEVLSK